MRHRNSVFHDLLKHVPWSVFGSSVDEHKADNHARRLSTKSQFIALLYGQFSGANSLREIVAGLESHAVRLYHMGTKPVSRSTLADANALRPIYAAITPANVDDITAAQAMPIEAGATYVFDLGCYDYGWWAKMDGAGCRIITRFKSNTPLVVTAELDLPEGSEILSDRIGLLPRRQARSRKNPLAFARPVRANLMHRRRLGRLIGDDPKRRTDPNQMVLQWA